MRKEINIKENINNINELKEALYSPMMESGEIFSINVDCLIDAIVELEEKINVVFSNDDIISSWRNAANEMIDCMIDNCHDTSAQDLCIEAS